MDKEAIKTSVHYERLREQHFDGGYFSESVRREAKKISELSAEEKKAFFKDAFNVLWEQADALSDRGSETAGSFPAQTVFDLEHRGLGEICLELSSLDEAGAREEDVKDYKCLGVWVESFKPVPRTHQEYINAPGDDLGLETGGPTMIIDDSHPRGWEDGIYANFDGSFPEDGYSNLDYELLRLLDAKETLDIVEQHI